MFQTAELGQTVSKEDFDRISNDLRTELLALQQELRTADFPVIVAFAGVDGAGKGKSSQSDQRMDGPALDRYPGL